VNSGSLPQEASQISVAAFDPLTPDDYRDSRDSRKTERLLGKNRAIGKEDSWAGEIHGRIAGIASLPAKSKPRKRRRLAAWVRWDGRSGLFDAGPPPMPSDGKADLKSQPEAKE